MIIALLNQKGGVGKTTLAIHVASEFARIHCKVMVVDADPQGSALDWSEARRRAGYRRLFGVVGIPRETLHQEIRAIAPVVDHVVIDGPPRVTSLARSAMMAADFVLIPVQPSPYDVWACTEIVSLVREAMIFKPQLRAAFVISRKVVRTIIGREVSMALERFGLPVLQSSISQRVAFAESAINGSLVGDLHPRGPAQSEVQMLVTELLREFRV
jgi:chromosome partitioning protein